MPIESSVPITSIGNNTGGGSGNSSSSGGNGSGSSAISQKLLEQNEDIIATIVENLQLGRLDECMQHYMILQGNLIALASELDNYPTEDCDAYAHLMMPPSSSSSSPSAATAGVIQFQPQPSSSTSSSTSTSLNPFPDAIMRKDCLDELLPFEERSLPSPPIIPSCSQCAAKKISARECRHQLHHLSPSGELTEMEQQEVLRCAQVLLARQRQHCRQDREKRSYKRWSDHDKYSLLLAIAKYGLFSSQKIALVFPDRTEKQIKNIIFKSFKDSSSTLPSLSEILKNPPPGYVPPPLLASLFQSTTSTSSTNTTSSGNSSSNTMKKNSHLMTDDDQHRGSNGESNNGLTKRKALQNDFGVMVGLAMGLSLEERVENDVMTHGTMASDSGMKSSSMVCDVHHNSGPSPSTTPATIESEREAKSAIVQSTTGSSSALTSSLPSSRKTLHERAREEKDIAKQARILLEYYNHFDMLGKQRSAAQSAPNPAAPVAVSAVPGTVPSSSSAQLAGHDSAGLSSSQTAGAAGKKLPPFARPGWKRLMQQQQQQQQQQAASQLPQSSLTNSQPSQSQSLPNLQAMLTSQYQPQQQQQQQQQGTSVVQPQLHPQATLPQHVVPVIPQQPERTPMNPSKEHAILTLSRVATALPTAPPQTIPPSNNSSTQQQQQQQQQAVPLTTKVVKSRAKATKELDSAIETLPAVTKKTAKSSTPKGDKNGSQLPVTNKAPKKRRSSKKVESTPNNASNSQSSSQCNDGRSLMQHVVRGGGESNTAGPVGGSASSFSVSMSGAFFDSHDHDFPPGDALLIEDIGEGLSFF